MIRIAPKVSCAKTRVGTWEAFQNAALPIIRAQKEKQGAGIHLLTETITSPTMAAQIAALQKALSASPMAIPTNRSTATMCMQEHVPRSGPPVETVL